jgi:hypothetical protein
VPRLRLIDDSPEPAIRHRRGRLYVAAFCALGLSFYFEAARWQPQESGSLAMLLALALLASITAMVALLLLRQDRGPSPHPYSAASDTASNDQREHWRSLVGQLLNAAHIGAEQAQEVSPDESLLHLSRWRASRKDKTPALSLEELWMALKEEDKRGDAQQQPAKGPAAAKPKAHDPWSKLLEDHTSQSAQQQTRRRKQR